MVARCLWSTAVILTLTASASALASLPALAPTEYLIEPPVARIYHVIIQNGDSERVYHFPINANDTVIDAIARIDGLPAICSRRKIKMRIARPTPAKKNGCEILPIRWLFITEQGDSKTNYQLMPGDQIHIVPGCSECPPARTRVHLQGFIQLQSSTASPGIGGLAMQLFSLRTFPCRIGSCLASGRDSFPPRYDLP